MKIGNIQWWDEKMYFCSIYASWCHYTIRNRKKTPIWLQENYA
jgi:hypothetical protein